MSCYHQLTDLNDDLLLCILSFVSELPYERSTLSKHATLTHVLPLVNKRFYQLCSKSDYLWKAGVERLVKNEPDIWGIHLTRSMQRLKQQSQCLKSLRSGQSEHLEQLRQAELSPQNTDQTKIFLHHRHVFQDALHNGVITKMPLLCDDDDQNLLHSGIQIGEEIDLYLVQSHHMAFMNALMKQYIALNQAYTNGMDILPPPTPSSSTIDSSTSNYPPCPTFVYLNEQLAGGAPAGQCSTLEKSGTIAPKVEVRECLIYPDNSAHVRLMPVSFVRIQSVSETSTTNKMIYDARVSTFNKQELTEHIQSKKQSLSYKNIFHTIMQFILSHLLTFMEKFIILDRQRAEFVDD